jgi:hypothetical protein
MVFLMSGCGRGAETPAQPQTPGTNAAAQQPGAAVTKARPPLRFFEGTIPPDGPAELLLRVNMS